MCNVMPKYLWCKKKIVQLNYVKCLEGDSDYLQLERLKIKTNLFVVLAWHVMIAFL